MENSLLNAYEQLQHRVDEVYKLQAELQIQALHDPLTGLHNRRYLDQALEVELARVDRQNLPLSVIIMDID
jgi:GGDEF domain-containing protein